MNTMQKKSIKIDKLDIKKAVKISSKIEGLSFERAARNKDSINLLKKHGRAFSLPDDNEVTASFDVSTKEGERACIKNFESFI